MATVCVLYSIDQFGTGKKTAPAAVEKPSDDRNPEDEKPPSEKGKRQAS